jgi:uncharacterized protein with von Willebrand factor type A (vWA) domain
VLDLLTGFVEELRAAGLPVSLTEGIDAASALTVVPVEQREVLREALAATLVKSADHRRAFDTAFDVYFARVLGPRGAEGDASPAGSPTSATPPNGGGPVPGGGPGSAVSPEELAAQLYQALMADDAAALAALARIAVAQLAGMEPGRPVGGTYYLYRTLRQLDVDALEARLRQAGAPTATGGRPPEPLEARLWEDEVRTKLARLRRAVEEEIRRLLVADRGAAALARSLRQPLPAEIDFMHASGEELRSLQRAILPLSRKLAVRLARRRRRHRRGPLDFRATIRHAMSSGGVPVELRYRPPHPAKPELFVVADISGSVASFARFTLHLVHALHEQFSKVRSFVFIDGVDEVTDLLERSDDIADAVRRVNTEADVVRLDGHSDYGRALTELWERWGHEVTSRTSVLLLGDARSNYHAPEAWVVAELAARARHVYWLNPEPRSYWGSGDSIVDAYGSHCDAVVEVRNLRQLERFVAELA